jgi:hypothetical protein
MVPSAEQLRLSMGELSAEEVRIAKAAYRLALVQHFKPCAVDMVADAETKRVDQLTEEVKALRRDAERYRWIEKHVTELPTKNSMRGEFAEQKTQWVLPTLISWADFCGPIPFAVAIENAIANERGGT